MTLKINKEILRLAIPNILSNISIPLISAVDTALMGHLSVSHLGAVGISAMIFNFIYWNFGFLRMGTTGMTSQFYGENNEPQLNTVLWRSLCISLIISFLLVVLCVPISSMSLYAFNVIDDQQSLVLDYFYIRIIAAPATLALYVLMGWFFGMQNAIYPLIITILINVVNLFFSYYFVVHLHWDIKGVAWGTVIAQYVGLFLAMTLLIHRYKDLCHFQMDSLRGKWSDWKSIFSINANIFLRTVCLTFAFGFFYAQSSSGGPVILATNVVLLQFLAWMSYGIDGFAFASESIVGKYFGAKQRNEFFTSINLSFIWAFVIAILYAALFGCLGNKIAGLYTSEIAVLTLIEDSLYMVAIMPLIAFACYIWDGIYIGLTEAHLMLQTMVISLLIYLGYYYLSVWQGKSDIWGAMMLFLGVRGLVQTLYWIFNTKFINLKDSVY